MVDDPPELQEENIHHPANKRVPRLFLPPSWYRVVSHGVSGLQDEILSTDQDVSRHSSRILSFLLPLLSLSLAIRLPRLYDRFFTSGWSSPFLFRISFSYALSSRAQSPISNDYTRRPQVDPTSDVREVDRCKRIKRIVSRRCKNRSFPPHFFSLPYFRFIYLLDVSESKTMDYTRECILHRREGERANFQYLTHFPRLTEISQEARITL